MLPKSMLSAVDHAEVGANLSKRGFAREDIQRRLERLVSAVVAFDSEQSLETLRLHRLTHGAGLSLADRTCLALARLRKTPVLTTDKTWSELRIGVDVRQIR
jgi:ribonuclease VapC